MSLFFLDKKNQRTDLKQPWSNQELAEFYRILDIARGAGLSIDWERGLSDEGDPWAVFLRPDTGEVVAHFARIDAVFIAVSSANNRMYKGEDVRSVVNQMLQSSHLLLPNSSASSNIYLHPGVVLTAFVVASYLLVTDEVFASEHEKITPPNQPVSDSTIIGPSQQHKNVFAFVANRAANLEDISAQNHAILLGAVMLAYSVFPITDPTAKGATDFWPKLNLINEAAANEKVKANANIDVENITKITSPQSEKTSELLSSWDSEANEVKINGESVESLNIGDEIGSLSPYIVNLLEVEDSMPDGTVDQNNPKFFYLANTAKITNLPPKTLKDINEERAAALDRDGQAFQVANDFQNLSGLLDIAKRAFNEIEGDNSLNQPLEVDRLGIMIESDGRFFVMGISEDRKSIQTKTSVRDREVTEFSTVNVEEGGGSNSDAKALADSKVEIILGHKLDDNQLNHLVLSDATDVVFYNGGHKHVQNFELGKDLLWFFLSPSQIDQAHSQILNKADMMISFSEFDTLTLINVIDSSSMEIFL